MSSSSKLQTPFKDFFDSYFKDEAGNYPECTGGRVWFVESIPHDKFMDFLDLKYKVSEKNPGIMTYLPTMILDKSLFKKLDTGLALELNGTDEYLIMMRDFSGKWETIKELKSAYYNKSDNYLTINGHKLSFNYKANRYYAEQLVECINAYLNQNEKNSVNAAASNSELVTDALDKIDERISQIEEKLKHLQEPQKEAVD